MYRTISISVLLLLASGFAWLFWPGSTTVDSTQPPSPAANNFEAEPVPASRIFVSGFVPTARIRSELEAIVPKTENGSRDNPVGGPIVDDVLTWNLNRSSINVSAADGRITASATIGGMARIRGKARLAGGDLGKLLGKITRQTDIPFSSHAYLGANALIASKPVLQPDWRLAPNLAVSLDLFKAEIPIKNFGAIPVHDLIRGELENTIAKLQGRLNDRLQNDDFVEEAARKAQVDLCKAHDFDAGDGRKGWLVITPSAWEATQPYIDAAGIRLGLGLRARTEVSFGEKPADPECRFPQAVEIREGLPEPSFTLAVPAALAWKQLSAAITGELHGNSFNAEGAGHQVSIDPENVQLAPYGDRVLATIDFTGRISGFLGARFDGRVYLTARPVLIREQQTLRFEAVEVSIESKEALSATGIFGTLAAPLLENLISRTAVFDLSSEAERAKSAAENARQALNNDQLREHGIVLEGKIDSITLDRIDITEDALGIRLSATGQLSANVDSLMRE